MDLIRVGSGVFAGLGDRLCRGFGLRLDLGKVVREGEGDQKVDRDAFGLRCRSGPLSKGTGKTEGKRSRFVLLF